MSTINESMVEVILANQGLITMSDEIEKTIDYILLAQIPVKWKTVS